MSQLPMLTSILAVIVVLTAAPAAAQDVWSATLTVGISSPTVLGYVGFPDTSGSEGFQQAGSISDAEFSLDGERYTVEGAYQWVFSDGGRAFTIVISPPFTQEGWSFTADSETLLLDEATHFESDGYPGFDFLHFVSAPDLGWTEGQEVSVGLSGPESVPVLPVPALGILLALLSAAGIAARRRIG